MSFLLDFLKRFKQTLEKNIRIELGNCSTNNESQQLFNLSVVTTSTSITTESNKTIVHENYLLNVYTTIVIAIVAIVLIMAMLTGIVIYKIRVNYLIKRQINQLKRIDKQLELERHYEINGWNCITL